MSSTTKILIVVLIAFVLVLITFSVLSAKKSKKEESKQGSGYKIVSKLLPMFL